MKVKTPTLIQIEAVECGAVTLGIIMRYYGLFVPIEELRVACGVSRSGSKANNILKAAREYGLEAQGWKHEIKDLKKLTPPFAVFWNFNHFLVVEGIGRNKVYLNDPATGPREVTLEEFESSFTGVALTFKPGPQFKKGGESPVIWRSLLKMMPPGSITPLIFLLLTGLGVSAVGVITPSFQRAFIDYYLILGLDLFIRPLLWIIFVTVVVTAALQWLKSFILARFSTHLAISMEGAFFWHVLRLPISFFDQRSVYEIVKRTALNDHIASLLSGQLADTFVSILTIFPYALLIFTYNWKLALLGVGMALINLISMRFVKRARKDSNIKLVQARGELTGTLMASLQRIESIKATGTEDDVFARLAGCQAKLLMSNQTSGSVSQTMDQIPFFLNQFNTLAMLTLGAFAIMNGELSIGSFLAFQSLMSAFLDPFTKIANLGGDLQIASTEMTRLDDIYNAKLDPLIKNDNPGSLSINETQFTGDIELRDLTFGYDKTLPPLINNLSLSIKTGERVAFVGASGSGKSTIILLIAGILEPWSGEILFDGRNRIAWSRKSLAKSIGYVGQRIYLFAGSIKDNLTLFDDSIPMEDIVLAAKDAQIHETIVERPGGYLSPVQEGGLNFSGGQRQRMDIARALARNLSLLIMDEATSALDPIGEMEIDLGLRRRKITTIISAHRLSTIRDSNQILVMNQGAVVERGKHDDLISLNGYYTKLVQS